MVGQHGSASTETAVPGVELGGEEMVEEHGQGAPEPCLTDWKIEMNPDQEYTDPIKIYYQ